MERDLNAHSRLMHKKPAREKIGRSETKNKRKEKQKEKETTMITESAFTHLYKPTSSPMVKYEHP